MVAQTNQVAAGPLAKASSPDPKRICINCHGPTAAAIAGGDTLPLDAKGRPEEGVSCTGCHQFDGVPTSGGGGISSSYIKGLVADATYFGPFVDPAASSAHQSKKGRAFDLQNQTCANCHNVNLDRDHDGEIVKGRDLVLQQTYDEYGDYRRAGGRETCVTCHMPVLADLKQAAELPNAPVRAVRDHSFVGVDYPLDVLDPAQAAKTEALMRGAGRVRIDPASVTRVNGLSFAVSIENTSSGHNLPTGFGFARQMWLEVQVVSAAGVTLFSSGVLARPEDDLCDSSTLDEVDNPMKAFFRGCATSDKPLVNIQAKLVDKLEADVPPALDARGEPVVRKALDGKETWLQFVEGGPVARIRGEGGGSLATLRPFETRSFGYKAAVDTTVPLSINVRLLFRHLPPNFVRALGAAQPAGQLPKLAPLVPNIRIVPMATDKLDLK